MLPGAAGADRAFCTPQLVPSVAAQRGSIVEISGIFSALIVGLIIGALGRLVIPGKQNIPIWLTILIGIVAALVGTFIVQGLSDTDGFDGMDTFARVPPAPGAVFGAAQRGGGGGTPPP